MRWIGALAPTVMLWASAASCGGPTGSPPAMEEGGSPASGGRADERGGTDDGGASNSDSGGRDPARGGTAPSGGVAVVGGSGGSPSAAGAPGEAGTPEMGGASGGAEPGTGGSDEPGGETGGSGAPASGGSDGTGGTSVGGVSGSPSGGDDGAQGGASACATTCGEPLAIDDFEDGLRAACILSEWKSDWWVTNDGTGFAVPEVSEDLPVALDPPREGSCMGLHVEGDGFSEWGVVVGVTFHNPDETVPRPVDLNEYNGVRFWSKGSGSVKFQVPTVYTEVESAGGICTSGCYDHFATGITLASDWAPFEIPFSLLKNQAQTVISSTDLENVLAFYFNIEPQDAFELWLDDPSFY